MTDRTGGAEGSVRFENGPPMVIFSTFKQQILGAAFGDEGLHFCVLTEFGEIFWRLRLFNMKIRLKWLREILTAETRPFSLQSVGAMGCDAVLFVCLLFAGNVCVRAEPRSEERRPDTRAAMVPLSSASQTAPEGSARERLKSASDLVENGDPSGALGLLEKISQEPETPAQIKASALLLFARIHSDYGHPSSWAKAKEVCLEILAMERAGAQERIAAREVLVSALWNLGQYTEAKRELEGLVSINSLPKLNLAGYQIRLAKILISEQAYREAHFALDKATGLLEAEVPHTHAVCEGLAEAQLIRGISFYEEGDVSRAKPQLERVLGMEGQSKASPQTREALLRLSLRKLIPEETPVLKVLFIGSSHTIRGNVPYLVEQMAASAPEGNPRVRAGEHVRTGTGMRAFWEEGDSRITARGRIAAESWDAVVVETFFKNERAVLESYGSKYAQFVREKGSRLVVYESPVAKETPYPEGFAAFHSENIRLGRMLDVSIAPSVFAWMQFLGAKPEPKKIELLYADWIHASLRGAYLTACCIYPALTHTSPVGLAHPEEISADEARILQEIGWSAFQETEAARKR